MRIKIDGEITAERLAEALQSATKQFPADAQVRFYGANLYLTAFNAEGLPLELVDQHGQTVMVKIAAPSGTLARPALTAEGAERRSQANESAAAQRAEEEAEFQRHEAQVLEQRRQYQAKFASAKRTWEAANSITSQQMKTRPEEFVAELNKIVYSVWCEMKPVEPMGKQKDEPKPLPVFSTREGMLMLDVSTWKTPRQVHNPIYSSRNHDRLQRFWAHAAWAEACTQIEKVMASWAGQGQTTASSSA